MLSKAIFVAVAAAGAATAQVQNYTSPLDMKIDPNSVPAQTRSQWCGAQYTSCSTLCGNTDKTNSCEAETLEYSCICGSNNSAPGLQFYTQTMPTFICQQAFQQCNEKYIGHARDQEMCKTNIMDQCGTADPNKASTASSSTTSGASTTSSAAATGSSGAGSASSTSSQRGIAAPTMAAGQGIAAAAAAVGVFAYLV